MRLRRRKQAEEPPSELVSSIIVHSAQDLDQGAREYRQLLPMPDGPDTREAARAMAQRLALAARALDLFRPNIEAEVEAVIDPAIAQEAIWRLGYAFAALAQDPRDERTLLTLDELDELVGGPVEEWLTWFRKALADDGA